MFEWKPDNEDNRIQAGQVDVPFFEDARADWAPYYASEKSERDARAEVQQALAQLGASSASFQSGEFTINGKKRLGYHIRFYYRGAPALIRVAGLPMKNKTATKAERVRVQALLNVRDWLLNAARAPVFSPGSDPLVPFMLTNEAAGTTIQDGLNFYLEQGRLPHLPAPRDEE